MVPQKTCHINSGGIGMFVVASERQWCTTKLLHSCFDVAVRIWFAVYFKSTNYRPGLVALLRYESKNLKQFFMHFLYRMVVITISYYEESQEYFHYVKFLG